MKQQPVLFMLVAAAMLCLVACTPQKQDADKCMRACNAKAHCSSTEIACNNDFATINSCIDNSDDCRVFYQNFNVIAQVDQVSDKGVSCFKDCVSNSKITNQMLIDKYNCIGDCNYAGVLGAALAFVAMLAMLVLF